MTSPLLLTALFRIVSMLLEMLVFGMIAAWIWAASRVVRSLPLLTVPPFAGPRPATWGPGTLLALVLLYFATQTAAWAGYDALVGVDLAKVSARYRENFEDRNAAPADAPRDPAKARQAANDAMHLMAWNATFSALFLAAFPWVFRLTSGARLADLGLTPVRWPEQIQVGIVAGLLVAPAVYIIHALALRAYPPRLHPVQDMLGVEFNPVMATISVLSAAILAPIFEEILFRGVLQGWLGRVFREMADEARGRSASDLDLLDDPAVPAPGPPLEAGPSAVVLTAAFFAAVHYAQWPTPIPLFVLALVMGWLRLRTGSLLVPIVVHALFNGCSTTAMLASQLGGAAKVKDHAAAPIGTLLSGMAESLAAILR